MTKGQMKSDLKAELKNLGLAANVRTVRDEDVYTVIVLKNLPTDSKEVEFWKTRFKEWTKVKLIHETAVVDSFQFR